MTQKREECGIPINKVGDIQKFYDPVSKTMVDKIFVREIVVKDDNGDIMGVEKIWQ